MLPTEALVPFAICALAGAATLLGALPVLGRDLPSPRRLAFVMAFVGGAMVYISLVEIFWKSHGAFTQSLGNDRAGYQAATLAFFAGVLLLAAVDRLFPNPHTPIEDTHDNRAQIGRLGWLTALTLIAHNIPEGMATFFSVLDSSTLSYSLPIAIGIHNVPEGISIAVPIYYATGSRKLALGVCLIAALAEPVGALLGYTLLQPWLGPQVYGLVFGMISGVMVYLALDELLPTAQRYAKGHDAVYGIISGMGVIALSLVLFR